MKGKTRWQGDTVQHQQFRQHARRSLGGHATFSWFIMARAWCSASKWASQARPPTDPAVILDGMVSIFPQSSCQNILADEVAELGFTNVFQNHLICSILSGTSKKSSLVGLRTLWEMQHSAIHGFGIRGPLPAGPWCPVVALQEKISLWRLSRTLK